ncbi:hypothetical protein BS47DRAFT_1340973 [Hydnum rufescens UP504]|uniref:PSP proline-rich domain-containing protein n=1 Tax=Hydnum rufescens UP504 TaxID=1448309 RepID=A0A9P6DWF9_9AGAM|nr:hypothetical protein BS47DRAFT_1340973 [Hydnum rufescens UP504]
MGDCGGEGGPSSVEYSSVKGEERIVEQKYTNFVIDCIGVVGVGDPSSSPSLESFVDHTLYYSVDWDTALGEVKAYSDPYERVCFNCGSPSHVLSAWPRLLLARSAFAESHDFAPTRRIHHVGEDQARRLEFVSRFKPGQIQTPELRDALGLDDPYLDSSSRLRRIDELPWYHGMMKWGYPPGYSSVQDPIDVVSRRILGEDETSDFISGPPLLAVYDDADTGELGAFGSCAPQAPIISPSSPSPRAPSDPRRWVDFPTTLFKSSLLPVSTVYIPLPPLTPEPRPSATFTQDRQELWMRIVRGRSDASPPKSAPPPLPPPKILPWREPQRVEARELFFRNHGEMQEENGESDMDFSE